MEFCARAGDDQICRCKEMAEWFIHILILNISFGADERLIQIAFSADMYYLIGFQKLRKNAADSLIDRDGAETSADDQNYWAIGRKMGRTGVPPDDLRAEALHGSGEPVRTALSSGRYLSVSGKLQHTLEAAGIQIFILPVLGSYRIHG